jgi:uncharacterized protein (TIRG00374 family)
MKWVARISLVVGLAAMGFTVYSVGPQAISNQLRTIGGWFFLIFAIEIVITILDSAAIYALANRPEGPGFGQVVVAQMARRAITAVTPGGNLGEATKASILSEQSSANRAVAAVIYCGLVSLVLQLVMVAIGSPLTAIFLDRLPMPLRWGLGIAGVLAAASAVGLALLVRRGMVASIADFGVKLHIISAKRRKKWRKRLDNIDERLTSTTGGAKRRVAGACVLGSKSLGWLSIAVILYASGYQATPGVLAAILSAGVVLGWVAALIPLGLGVHESGNYALFSALRAPPAVGVSLALARRVIQLMYAALGFTVLGIWRLSHAARRARNHA